MSEGKNQEPRNNVELVKLLILPNSQKRNAVEVESLIPYVSSPKLPYYNFISSICVPELGETFFCSAETEKQYATIVNNMSTKCCKGRSLTTSYATSRYSCCNGILRSKRLYECNKTKYGNGHLIHPI